MQQDMLHQLLLALGRSRPLHRPLLPVNLYVGNIQARQDLTGDGNKLQKEKEEMVGFFEIT